MGDWTKHHPWRAPGRAPVSDPCGLAGGYNRPTGGGGETPAGAKQGDPGSKLPPLKGVQTEWLAGPTLTGLQLHRRAGSEEGKYKFVLALS